MWRIPSPAHTTSRCRRRAWTARLFEPSHFARHRGSRVRVRLEWPLDGRRNFRGILQGYRDGNILVDVDGAEQALPISRIGTARLVPEV